MGRSTAAAMSSRRCSLMGMSSGVPWLCQGRAGRSRAREHPFAKKALVRRGGVRGWWVCEITTSFPGTAGCSWPTLTGGLWHFWVLGRRLLRKSPQATRRRQPVTRHRVAESGEIRLAQQQGRPWVPRVQRMRTKAVDPQPESGRFAKSAPEMLRVQCQFGARVGFGGSRCAVLSRLCS